MIGTKTASPLPGTAALSDALDALGLSGAIEGLHPVRVGQRMCGPAFTVTYEPVDADGGTVGDFLDDVPKGAVVVIDNAARTDCTVWGGIMSRVGGWRALAGTMINGTCRDTEIAAEVGYPIWALSTFMRTGKDRVRVQAVQRPLVLYGVRVRPGDVIVGDDDGIVAVPVERWEEVRDRAEQIEEIEDRILDAVREGAALRDARARHGYHFLQARREGS